MRTNTHMLTCMPKHSHSRHTFTCRLYTHMHTHIYMHTCLHTHTHTYTPSHQGTWPSGSHPRPSCAEEETVRDQAQSWGCWSGKGSEVPSGMQPPGSAELQGLLKVEDTQHCPATSPPGPLAPFLKAELPSSPLSFQELLHAESAQAAFVLSRTHSPQRGPAMWGETQPRVVSSRERLSPAENGLSLSGTQGCIPGATPPDEAQPGVRLVGPGLSHTCLLLAGPLGVDTLLGS